ncbi:MAG TPA: 4-amino-4-deoxychorismate lyase [Bacteroidales bacterium]|nr:MAG: hypothetical protein A2W98_06290 [Bacteroidetes bacterium GWF2_33_38]OFY85971.1 MAG: hypothetical protein A2236_00795 [Bacteroidetes bacterium RIFOXYA2_FULL_33_7]HBF88746.1 4-amino-4-deoxychorismate lyase [Bacteroidales bacterium]
MSEYIVYNGEYLKKETFQLSTNNRSFRYGDGLFETMHANGRKTQFLTKHFERILNGMQKLKMNIPNQFTVAKIDSLISSLLSRNKMFQGAKIRLAVYRVDGGLYTPDSNNISYIIESEKLEDEIYSLNKTGLKLGIYNSIPKPINYFSDIKSSNSLIYVLAGIFKKENNFDDCILINENNNLVEAISSNIFMVKDDTIYTPSINEGCIRGIMRDTISEIASNIGYIVYDDCILTSDDLLEADEIFLTNAIQGIRWVVALGERRFFCNVSKQLINELNKFAF